ncbi:Unannotated [Lentimonas sp. CC4]|nr:Unannotated [Lentimonas sp. CC4]CAA6686182.1 Unannotated [Lentimonas sp. CC6]CAA7074214.1 Unannotated [Lentimonas sp. CC4]CAA7171572.1 Unannotated [Lentimonas sp. CC21]CAA7183088.1 Unannotated [Lentimonas sp. CC8]
MRTSCMTFEVNHLHLRQGYGGQVGQPSTLSELRRVKSRPLHFRKGGEL